MFDVDIFGNDIINLLYLFPTCILESDACILVVVDILRSINETECDKHKLQF